MGFGQLLGEQLPNALVLLGQLALELAQLHAEQARELANAQKRVNELRLLNEQAQKRLTAARASEAAAKKAYDSENAAFERRVMPEPQQPQ